MSLIFMLSRQAACSKVLKFAKPTLLNLVRPITIQAKPAQPSCDEGHDEKNMRLKRPQSPHLTIYAPQLTSMLSITQRATGMMLGSYLVGFGLAGLVFPEDLPCIVEQLQCYPPILSFVKFTLSLPFCYHAINALRHLIWDTGNCLSLKEIYITGYLMLLLVLGSTIALTVL